MRPKILEIEGLQSYRELARIDFEHLSRTGLFGIFGPTGSGKSTILDAITLSLYGKVTRAKGITGIINSGENRLRVLFRFDILRPMGRVTFEVERIFKKKKDSEYGCECKSARLTEITEEKSLPLSEKATEINLRIEELIGLNHEDFIRAVVLPQNKFQEFLLLDKGKKRDMLERIFYLEEYGRKLNEGVSNRKSALGLKLEGVLGKLAALEDATDEKLKEAKEALEVSLQKWKVISGTFDLAEKECKQANEVWELMKEQEQIDLLYEEHLKLEKGMVADKLRLEKGRGAESLKDEIAALKRDEKMFLEMLNEQKSLQEAVPALIKETAELSFSLNKHKEEAQREMSMLSERKALLMACVTQEQELVQIFERLNNKRNEFKSLTKEKRNLELQHHSLNQAILEKEISLRKINEEIAGNSTDVQRKDKILALSKREEDLGKNKQQLVQLRQNVKEMEGKIAGLKKRHEEARKEVESMNGLALRLAGEVEANGRILSEKNEFEKGFFGLIEKKAMAEKLLEKEKFRAVLESEAERYLLHKNGYCTKMEETKKELEGKKAKLASLSDAEHKVMANSLAKALKENEECPVCGSKSHPSPYSLEMEEEDFQYLQKKEELEKELRALEDVELGLQIQLRNSDEALEKVKADIVHKIEEENSIKTHLKSYMDGIEEQAAEKVLRNIEDLILSGEKTRARLEEIERENTKKVKEKEELNGKLSETKITENSLLSEISANEQNLRYFTDTIQTIETRNLAEEREVAEQLQEMGISSAKAAYDEIRRREQVSENLQRELAKLSEQIAIEREQFNKSSEALNQYSAKVSAVETEGSGLNAQVIQLKEKIFAINQGQDTTTLINGVIARLTELKETEEKLQAEKNLKETKLSELQVKKSVLDGRVESLEQTLLAQRKRLTEAIEKNGFKSFEEVLEQVLSQEERNLIEERVKKYDQDLLNMNAQRKILQGKLAGRTISREQWLEKNQLFEKLTSEREEAYKRLEVGKSELVALTQRNRLWNDAMSDSAEIRKKADLLDQLGKVLRANGFIDYVAEERLRYVSAEASELLGDLTRHKYAIELDSESSFVIRDNHNGGMLRSVASLSGGETFLTALSIALALSKHIQLKGQSPLEFFFLDEGFGTLDGNLLDTVMDALERISNEERVIGLISHVPELKQRILRRLLVEGPSGNGSGSSVRIELG